MGRAVVGLIVCLVLASCSNDPSTTQVTGIKLAFETTWQLADDIEEIEALATAELVREAASVLVPSISPPGASDAVGRLSIRKTFPTDLVEVNVHVSFREDQQEKGFSLTSLAADGNSSTCSESGGSNWTTAAVRTVTGCVATNQAGLTFIQWEEAANRYFVETRMEPDVALSWLESWKPLP